MTLWEFLAGSIGVLALVVFVAGSAVHEHEPSSPETSVPGTSAGPTYSAWELVTEFDITLDDRTEDTQLIRWNESLDVRFAGVPVGPSIMPGSRDGLEETIGELMSALMADPSEVHDFIASRGCRLVRPAPAWVRDEQTRQVWSHADPDSCRFVVVSANINNSRRLFESEVSAALRREKLVAAPAEFTVEEYLRDKTDVLFADFEFQTAIPYTVGESEQARYRCRLWYDAARSVWLPLSIAK